MAFRESVTVQFGADVTPFQRGLAQINSELNAFKHELSSLGGRNIGHLLGIYGVIEGFKKIYEYAKDARTEAEKTGEAMSESVQIVAQIGDGWDSIKKSIGAAGTAVVGFFGLIGSNLGQMMGIASSPKEIENLRRAEEAQKGVGANGLTPEQQKKTAETAKQLAAERAKYEKEFKEVFDSELTIQEQIALHEDELKHLREQGLKLAQDTIPWYKNHEEQLRKHVQLVKERAAAEEEVAKAQEKQKRLAEAISNLGEAQGALVQRITDARLPNLAELAHSGREGSGLASEVERFEKMAMERSGSAPNDSKRMFAHAQELRSKLSGTVKSSDSDPFGADRDKIDKLFQNVKEMKDALIPKKVGR